MTIMRYVYTNILTSQSLLRLPVIILLVIIVIDVIVVFVFLQLIVYIVTNFGRDLKRHKL